MLDVTIFDSSLWSDALALVHQGLTFLDSIVLFDFRDVHMTFLDFDIAVFAFFLVWNAVSLFHSRDDSDDE